MKNIIRTMFVLVILLVVLSIPVYAAENDGTSMTIETFKKSFNLHDEAFKFEPEVRALAIENGIIKAPPSDELVRNYNVFEHFQFTGSLTSKRISTFSCDKNLFGQGDEGVMVGLLVYTLDQEAKYKVVDYKVKTIGASGLYSDAISFETAKKQYLLVAVKYDEVTESRVYEVITKEVGTKTMLENIELKFLPSNQGTVVVEQPFNKWVQMNALDF